MHLPLAIVVAVTVLAGTAQAERRMFIISANADGYGIDRCLANGERCGAAVAKSYCKSRQFTEAASYRKIDRDDITGAIPASGPGACTGVSCNVVAIVCQR